jgi:hypothetical protein
VDVQFCQGVGRLTIHLPPIDCFPGSDRLTTEKEIFGHRQLFDPGQLLIDHGNAMIEGFAW